MAPRLITRYGGDWSGSPRGSFITEDRALFTDWTGRLGGSQNQSGCFREEEM
jgi:hypothetical protein